jgi:mycoredoxin
MPRPLPRFLDRTRRYALYLALFLALVLVGFDRYAAYVFRPDADSREVVIYTTAWCPYCARLRTSLGTSGIPFQEYDVEHSLPGQLGFWTLRGRGVPVSAIGPEIIYGYDVPRLTAAFKRLGYDFVPQAAGQASVNGQSSLSK